MNARELLNNGTEALYIQMSEEQLEKLIDFYALLSEANRHMNLTAVNSLEETVTRHYLDSLAPLGIERLAEELNMPGRTMIDVGTGAGFPGVPLAIALPDLQITLFDSLNKRIRFLDDAVEMLGIKNAHPLAGRAEDFAKDPEYRERFDFAVSRAVAALPVLSEYGLPFVKENGTFIAYKGADIQGELESAKNALEILGGNAEVIPYDVPGTYRENNLVIIKKVGITPEKYPRRAGIPSKRPL